MLFLDELLAHSTKRFQDENILKSMLNRRGQLLIQEFLF